MSIRPAASRRTHSNPEEDKAPAVSQTVAALDVSNATGQCFHDVVKIMVQMKNRLTKLQKVVGLHLVIILLALCHGYYSAVHLQDVCRIVTIRYSVKTAKQIVEFFPPPNSSVIVVFSELNLLTKHFDGNTPSGKNYNTCEVQKYMHLMSS